MSARSTVLVIGGGAREHALATGIARGGHDVVVAPGNAGTARAFRNVAVRVDDVAAIVEAAKAERAELVVVGPELPLTLGVVDALAAHGIRAFGPSREAAQLEGSKSFMKRFLTRHAIPTAAYAIFDDADAAERYVREAARPLVVKADGLAAGKGVVVASTPEEAIDAIDRMMRAREFGDAGKTVIIEELLAGEEASFHVICDGTRYVPLVAAQDHKRIFEGDRGPNTGGMGAYAPAPVVTRDVRARVLAEIVEPTLRGMAAENTPFRGVLFVGLMIDHGVPTVLEFNVRFGDPETSVLVPMYRGDWFTLLDGAARGDLSAAIAATPDASSSEGAALCVVMAAHDYPGKPRTGDPIHGLEASVPANAFVHHAGTSLRDGAIVTAGGRVLTVGAQASTLRAAADLAYQAVAQITWDGEQHRRDIGHRALARR